MQTRPYPEKDGLRIWLSRSEQRELLEAVDDEPRRRIALQLGLHGLRTDEVLQVEPRHFRELSNGADGHVLIIPSGKTGKRETPVSDDLVERVSYLKSADRNLNADDPVVDVSKRSVRNWIGDAREVLVDVDERAGALGMHDLRRTWATDSYYSLALAGVPIAEQLTMSWGGWKQTSTGRETFRENYLGPVPDHVAAEALQHLPLV
jgi:integrase